MPYSDAPAFSFPAMAKTLARVECETANFDVLERNVPLSPGNTSRNRSQHPCTPLTAMAPTPFWGPWKALVYFSTGLKVPQRLRYAARAARQSVMDASIRAKMALFPITAREYRQLTCAHFTALLTAPSKIPHVWHPVG